jgi:L-alanine-DL-glutamate epimerase-like enolase superfamily enzyme
MKITDVRFEMFKWPRARPITNGLYTYTHNLLNIVVVETDEDVTGIGLAAGVPVSPDIGRSIAEHFKTILVGLDPLDNERIWYEMWRPKLVGRRGITTRVLGGIDIALWDVKGKVAGLPMYKLLGGFRDRVDTYIAGGYYEEGKTLDDLANEMTNNVERGATAVKIKVGAVPINDDIARVRVCREAVGPNVRLMVDANNAYRHYQAIEFARKAEPYDLFWFEEPVEPDDYIGQREITRSTSIPIAAGENEYTRYGFRDLINHRAVDILQPDALVMGGVTEFMKVAALAQANDLDISAHGSQYVHIHLMAAIPNGLILEYYHESFDPMHGKIWKHELDIEEGKVRAPDRPGFGLEPRWETLEPYRVT